MALYRTIQTKFWSDVKVADTFTPEDKYFFLYLMTNDYTNVTGCYEVSLNRIATETGYNIETVKRLIDRMENVHDVIHYDPDTHEVLILNWHKYNWTKSKDLISAVKRQATDIKSEKFRTYVLEMVEEKTVPTPSYDGGGTSNANANAITNANKEKKTSFTSPTYDEVSVYCQERKNGIDPQHFIDYYQARGWVLTNGKKMVDWKAAVRTWEKNEPTKPKERKIRTI